MRAANKGLIPERSWHNCFAALRTPLEGRCRSAASGTRSWTARTQRPVEVERGTNETQVRERLRKVAQRLAARARLFRVQPQVVGVAEHLLEQKPGLLQPPPVGAPGARQRLDKPKTAHVEGPLRPRQPVGSLARIVAVNQPAGGQPALRKRLADRVNG